VTPLLFVKTTVGGSCAVVIIPVIFEAATLMIPVMFVLATALALAATIAAAELDAKIA
jgi:hypothetical protein